MSDLQSYIAKRKAGDPEFAKDYDKGYEDFKIGVKLKIAREEAGLTQEQLALKLKTKKSKPLFDVAIAACDKPHRLG